MRRPSSASALLAIGVAAIAGCGSPDAEPPDDAVLTVYVSVPQAGPSAADGRDVADGALLALAAAGGTAGGVRVRAEVLDDTDPGRPGAGWSASRSAANARAATRDSTAIAYLGELESGATRASLPITNSARMLQVSAASTAGDLIAPSPASDDLPEAQPGGTRTFGRVIPSDRAQAAAAAGWARQLGAERVATRSDGSAFGDAMVTAFEQALDGPALVDGAADLVYYGGGPGGAPVAARTMVSDAALDAALPAGALATSAALDPSQLPPAGMRFAAEFEREYGRRPGRYAAYGYEAMAAILDSIDRAADPTDRAAVVDAFFEIADRDSVLGTYSIDRLGQTTLDRMTGYELAGANARPVAERTVP